VIDHGYRYDLGMQTYEWLRHASEDSYHYWYYNQNAGFPGNEQSFYDLVPVITGPQGDYRARGATPAQDGPPIPSGRTHGDLNTPGSLMYEAWRAVEQAPAGRLRDLGVLSYLAMIYETAWHEEDEVNYSDSDCYGAWLDPDDTWDGVNTWALKLQNHVRHVGLYAAAATWADSVRDGLVGPGPVAAARDVDLDGEDEYLLSSDRVFLVFERYGGRCVLAAAYDPARTDADLVIGAPLTNPSAPGEEEYSGNLANRCSGFKDMNGGGYVDAPYDAVAVAGGWRFQSPDDAITKTLTIASGSWNVAASYLETLPGALYVRFGLSPNPLDLAFHGHAHLRDTLDLPGGRYRLANTAGGGAVVRLGTASWNANPADAGHLRRNLALTEQVELYGDGAFQFSLELTPGSGVPLAAPNRNPLAALDLAGPWPSPTRGGPASLAILLPAAARVSYDLVDVGGRRVGGAELGLLPAGRAILTIEPRTMAGDELGPGLYLVRVRAGAAAATRRWIVLH
jgi:hypothetical protein